MIILDAYLQEIISTAGEDSNGFSEFVYLIGRDKFAQLSDGIESLTNLLGISDDCFCQYIDDSELYRQAVRKYQVG